MSEWAREMTVVTSVSWLFRNDMTYGQHGLVLLVHTHGAAFLLAEECVSTAELPVTEVLQTIICSDVFAPLRLLLAGRI